MGITPSLSRVAAGCLAAALASGPVDARLLCAGTDPAFLLDIEGGEARFDRLGDGTFTILPPIDEGDLLRSARSMVLLTQEDRLPVFIAPQQCETTDATLPLTVEISVSSTGDAVVFRGCCQIR